ncbi:hypothetical protein E2C01_042425 [Portunus trituberculatus]|uniref:Uncharacterized protein n=1 Tax=Portunus trituberculatus TaxID=210409 RepID=A0A5B7FWH0_PORTR|nr:hypothetical protein [Portunus trituberculatus]
MRSQKEKEEMVKTVEHFWKDIGGASGKPPSQGIQQVPVADSQFKLKTPIVGFVWLKLQNGQELEH